MKAHTPAFKKNDWVRFQLISNHIVLEGYVIEISPDSLWVKIGKTPDATDPLWYSVTAMRLLHDQPVGATHD